MKLTIAVLTYNRAAYLGKMLDSIKNQTYTDFIVKIYDNASTDNTYDIVQEYLKDERFLYFRNKENIGATNNGNRAITECTTEYLSITHDDDIMHPDMISEELSILEKNNRVNLVCVNNDLIDTQGHVYRKNIFDKLVGSHDVIIEQKEFVQFYIQKKNIISCPTVMLRVSVLHDNNIIFRNGIGKSNDTFFWLELNMVNGCFYYISRPLYCYRVHTGQDSVNTLYMIPMLKKPVFDLLKKNAFDEVILFDWLQFANNQIERLFKANAYKRKCLREVKKNVLVSYKKEFFFVIFFYSVLYFPELYSLWIRMQKTKRRYKRFLRKII